MVEIQGFHSKKKCMHLFYKLSHHRIFGALLFCFASCFVCIEPSLSLRLTPCMLPFVAETSIIFFRLSWSLSFFPPAHIKKRVYQNRSYPTRSHSLVENKVPGLQFLIYYNRFPPFNGTIIAFALHPTHRCFALIRTSRFHMDSHIHVRW